MAEPIRVLIADDHAVLRRALSVALSGFEEIEIVGEAANGDEAVALTEQVQPDVVLMDVSMPRLNGVQATERIARRWPWVHVIGLSVHEENHTLAAQRMLAAGASEYLMKNADLETLVAAIRRARHEPA